MIKMYPHARWKISAASAAWLSFVIGASAQVAVAQQTDSNGQNGQQALNEIIVTAQKVKQNLQDVPITIAAVSGSDLAKANVTTMYDLPTLVSGLVWANEGAWVTPSIRGISTTDTSDGAPSPVAIYVDGVYQPASSATLMDLPDIASIQVLKGPQGTLYGQNAVAGAIVVETRGPTFTPTGSVNRDWRHIRRRYKQGFRTFQHCPTSSAGLSSAIRSPAASRRTTTTSMVTSSTTRTVSAPEGSMARMYAANCSGCLADGVNILATGLLRPPRRRDLADKQRLWRYIRGIVLPRLDHRYAAVAHGLYGCRAEYRVEQPGRQFEGDI